MLKLDKLEAAKLIKESCDYASVNGMRLGQAIYLLIPDHILNQLKEYDENGNCSYGGNFKHVEFFFEPNPIKATEQFIEFFVEKE